MDSLHALAEAIESTGRHMTLRDLDELLEALEINGWSWEYREPCQYTHSHTRQWCGHPGCREN